MSTQEKKTREKTNQETGEFIEEENTETEQGLRTKIVEVCRNLYSKGLLAAADGNVSFRLDEKHLLMTPSGVHKGFLEPHQIAIIDLESGEAVSGIPSSEKWMHIEVFKSCDKAKAVIHAHPPTAVAWSVARPRLEELPAESFSEVILAVGRIPFVPYARPGTRQMAEVLQSYLPKHRVMILSRHGALSWGESLDEAFCGMERLESSAHMLYLAEQLGGITKLPEEEVLVLKEMRQKLGERSL